MHSLLGIIPAHYPKAWVIAGLLWCAGLFVVGAAAFCYYVDWKTGYLIAFGSLLVIAITFMAAVAWYTVESFMGRVTPWRRDDA